MGNTISSPTKSVITRLIMYPVIITLLVTFLRLFGELMGGPAILFSRAEGGGFAIVGITWLPFIFGPYFAVKLFDRSMKPSSFAKTIIFAIVGFVILLIGGALAVAGRASPPSGRGPQARRHPGAPRAGRRPPRRGTRRAR